MAFQFLCPQGHLLLGEESQAGQQAQCPYCGSVFLVPQPIPTAPAGPSMVPPPGPPETGFQAPPQPQPAAEAPPSQPSAVEAPWFQQGPAVGPPPSGEPAAANFPFQPPAEAGLPFQPPADEAPLQPGAGGFPGIQTEPDVRRGGVARGAPSTLQAPGPAELPIVHVACPSGHQLETPREMLGQEALCPFCQIRFRLLLEDSVEYREEKAKERARREIRAGQMWLRWSIAAAVVVVFGLVLLIILSASH